MELESFFHVAIKVEDVDDGLDFYREHFDAEVLERGDASDGEGAEAVNHVALAIADKRVYLFDEAPYEAAGLVADLPIGFLHFGFVVEDVAATYAELAGVGVSFVMEPTVFGDLKIAFFTDPSGVRIELIEYL